VLWVLLFLLFFDEHVAILGDSGDMVISQILTRLPEAEDVAAPISHIDPLRARRNGSDLLDALFPDEQLAPSLGRSALVSPWELVHGQRVAGL